MFDLDSSWLVRLDTSMDFSDILAEEDALVPSLPAAGTVMANPGLGDAYFGGNVFRVPSLPNLAGGLRKKEQPQEDLQLVPDVMFSPSGSETDAGSEEEEDEDELMMPVFFPPGHAKSASRPAALAPLGGSLHGHATRRAAAPPARPALEHSLAHTASVASDYSASAAASFDLPPADLLTRAERVARYRAKRARRNFAKTIRYASRKKYAEIRPRIKGRFAKPEELAALRAAQAAMARGPGASDDDAATVPQMC